MKKIILLFIACVAFQGIAFAQQAQRANRNSETVVFVVKGDGIDCQGCANRIQNTLSLTRGVDNVLIDKDNDLVAVAFRTNRTSVERLIAALRRINFEVKVVEEEDEDEEEGEEEEN